MKTKIFLLAILLSLFSGCGSAKKNSYRIGVDPSWYPLELAGREKNALAFSIELLQKIAQHEKLDLTLVRMNWDNLLWGLREKNTHAILSTLSPYIFYQRKYSFSEPYLLTGPILVLPQTSKASSLDALRGKEIAIVEGSEAGLLLQVHPELIIRSFPSVPEALNAVVAEQADAAVIDNLAAQAYVNDLYQNTLMIVGEPLCDQGLRLLTLFNENQKLLDKFNKGLVLLKENGEYELLLRKWGLTSQSGPPQDMLDRQIQAFLK